MRWLMTILACLCIGTANAQQPDELIQQGNNFYMAQQFEQAANSYNEAMSKSTGALYQKAAYNKADALYKLGRKEDATKLYDELIRDKSTEKETLAKSYYNRGVMLSEDKKLEESVEAYKSALRLDPNDKDARENLQKALLELKKKNPQQKQQQQQQKQQQQQQQQSKLSQKEVQRQLDLLKQKEKQVKDRSQKQTTQAGSNPKDW